MIEVGGVIRQLRQKRNMTVRELADKAEISKSYLSQIENGQANVNVGVLEKISAALDTPVYLFFIQDSMEGISHVKRGQRSIERRYDGIVIEHLVDQQMVEDSILILNLPGGGKSMDFVAHQGKEFLYMQEGALTVDFSGYREYLLEEGDCLAYIARVPYTMSSQEPCRVLLRSAVSKPRV